MNNVQRVGVAAGVLAATVAGVAVTGTAVQAHGRAPEAANVKVVKAFMADVLDGHHGNHVPRYWTEDAQFHAGTLGTTTGSANIAGLLGAVVTAIPDMKTHPADIITQGDKVVVRLVVTGTQEGPLIGIPASGKPVSWDAVDVYRLSHGKIAEEWAAEDFVALLNDTGTYKAPWIP